MSTTCYPSNYKPGKSSVPTIYKYNVTTNQLVLSSATLGQREAQRQATAPLL